MTQTLTVTLAEILGAARVRAASLVPETSAYLALALAETVLSGRASRGLPSNATVDTDGGLAGAPRGDGDLGRSYRSLLRALLSASTGSMPSIAAVADPEVAQARPGLDAFAAELEAALIPLNRAAAKRALARLARETARSRRLRRLPAVGAELDALFGAAPTRPATPALPVAVRQPEAPRLDRTPVQSFAVEAKAATPRPPPGRPAPAPPPRAPTPTPPFAEEAFLGALDPSVHAPMVLETDGPDAAPEPFVEEVRADGELSAIEVEVAFTAVEAAYEPLPSVHKEATAPPPQHFDEVLAEAAPSEPEALEPVELDDDEATRPLTRLAPIAALAALEQSGPADLVAASCDDAERAAAAAPETSSEGEREVAPDDPSPRDDERLRVDASLEEPIDEPIAEPIEEPTDPTEIDDVARVETAPSEAPAPAALADAAPATRTPPPASLPVDATPAPHAAAEARPASPIPPAPPVVAVAAPPVAPAPVVVVAPPPVAAPRRAKEPSTKARPAASLPISPIAATDEALRPRTRSARELAASFAASGQDQSLRVAQRSLKAYVGLALTPPPPAAVRDETPSPPAPGSGALPALAPAVAFAGSVARRRVPLGWVLLAAFVFTALAALALRHPLVLRALVGR